MIFVLAFLLYGIYAAATDGISKALITTIVPKGETASAIGSVAGLTSLLALASSAVKGLIWTYVSGEAALIVSSCGVMIAAVYLLLIRVDKTATIQ